MLAKMSASTTWVAWYAECSREMGEIVMSDANSESENFDLETDFSRFLTSVIEKSVPNLSLDDRKELHEILSQPEFGYQEDFRNARLMSAILEAFPKSLRQPRDTATRILAHEVRGPMLESAKKMGIDLKTALASPRSAEVLSKGLSQEILRGQADALAMAAKSFPSWKSIGSPLVSFNLKLQSKAASTLVDYAYPYNLAWSRGGNSNAHGVASMKLKPQTYVFRGTDKNGGQKVDMTKVAVFHGMISPIGVAF